MTDEYLTGPKGTYRLLQRIGTGGMGVVHLALDDDGRTVAVKELHPSLIDDEMLRRLEREVTTMLRITSPYVAEIRDADVRGERPFVATRYVQGRALDATVRDRGPLEGERLVNVARGLVTALEAIHDAGIVHRDLKPSNVMLCEGDPVVIDFGIAQAIDATRLTHTGVVVGTPGYVAPEVVNGDVAEEPADVFAWAATVAYAATGRSPFGTGPAEVVFFRVTGGQSDLHGVPEPLLPVLRSALARDPAARPTAEALASRLADLNADENAPRTTAPTAPAAPPPATAPPANQPANPAAARPGHPAADPAAARPGHPGGPWAAHPGAAPAGNPHAARPGGPQAGYGATPAAHPGAPQAGSPGGPPPGHPGGSPGGYPGAGPVPGKTTPWGPDAGSPTADAPRPAAPARERLGLGLAAVVVAGAVALGYVLPVFGVLVSATALTGLGMRDRIRSSTGASAGSALGAALWRVVLVFVAAGVAAWLLEALLEMVARSRFTAGHWTALRDTPTSTVLAAFTALTVLLAVAVPRWRAPSRALAGLITGGEGATPVIRYGLMGVCVLLVIAGLFAPEPAWWPLPFGASVTFGDVLL